jgi:uroporphyrinogen-III synthase
VLFRSDRNGLAGRLAARIVVLRGGPRVIVGRPAERAGTLLDGLRACGVDVAHVPAIAIRAVPGGGASDRVLRSVLPADTVVLASASAAHATLDACARLDVEPPLLRWAAVGEATAAVLREAGIEDVFVPSVATGEALARELPLRPLDRVVVPRADIADARLVEILGERGARVIDVVVYETVEAPDASRPLLADALADGPVDAVVLTSGSTARGLLALAADDDARARLRETPVIAAGATTAAAARDAGYSTVVVAPSPSSAALATFVAAALGVAPVIPSGDPR